MSGLRKVEMSAFLVAVRGHGEGADQLGASENGLGVPPEIHQGHPTQVGGTSRLRLSMRHVRRLKRRVQQAGDLGVRDRLRGRTRPSLALALRLNGHMVRPYRIQLDAGAPAKPEGWILQLAKEWRGKPPRTEVLFPHQLMPCATPKHGELAGPSKNFRLACRFRLRCR